MKLERSDVEFPIWCKKVDKSLFEHNGTTIPEWACRMWSLQSIYAGVTSRKVTGSKAAVIFNRKSYEAWVTTAPHGRSSPAFRLWYDPALSVELKNAFVMSYMRSLEARLQKNHKIEEEISFWEFLDIEFDETKRLFKFVSYYTVRASFPHLFARLIGSLALKVAEEEFNQKGENRIHKQDWKPRSEVEFEIGAKNVLYTLFDSYCPTTLATFANRSQMWATRD